MSDMYPQSPLWKLVTGHTMRMVPSLEQSQSPFRGNSHVYRAPPAYYSEETMFLCLLSMMRLIKAQIIILQKEEYGDWMAVHQDKTSSFCQKTAKSFQS